MFNFRGKRESNLKDRIKKLEDERTELKREVEDLKIQKKISEEDIKHMVKMKEEKLDIDYQKKVMEVERGSEKAVAVVKDEYRDKVEANLEKQRLELKGMYGEILERLPNIAVKLKGDV